MTSKLTSKHLVHLLLFLLAIIGGGIILYTTDLNPWVSSDSVGYIENAKNLVEGRGLGLYRASGDFRPLSFHPPLYSLVLSMFGGLKVDYLSAVRWTNLVLYALSILLIGIGSYRILQNGLLSIVLTSLYLSTPIFIRNFSGVMAEPLFFTLGLSGLLSLIYYLQEDKPPYRILSAILCGLSAATRYSGVAFIAAGFTSLIVFSVGPPKRRWGQSVGYLALGLVPIGLWLFVQNFLISAASSGILDFHIQDPWRALAPLRTATVKQFWDWLPFGSKFGGLAYRTQLIILLLIGIAGSSLLLVFYRRRGRSPQMHYAWEVRKRFSGPFSLFVLFYLLLISLSYLFVASPKPALDARIYSPILLGGLMVFFPLVFPILTTAMRTNSALIGLGFSLLFLTSNIGGARHLASDLKNNGWGYTSSRWVGSGVIEEIRTLPDDLTIISNDIYAILFYTHRPAYALAETDRAEPADPTLRYGDDPNDNVQRLFRETGAALVLFNEIYWQLYPLYGDGTDERLTALTDGLETYAERWDGGIYFYPQSSPSHPQDEDPEIVWPVVDSIEPGRAGRGELVTLLGHGGYLLLVDGGGTGYNESYRTFKVYFDETPIGEIGCFTNRCQGEVTIPEKTSSGTHFISVEGGSTVSIEIGGE